MEVAGNNKVIFLFTCQPCVLFLMGRKVLVQLPKLIPIVLNALNSILNALGK